MSFKSLFLNSLIGAILLCICLWSNNAKGTSIMIDASPGALVNAVKIGNPSLAQFPKDTDAYARTVHDMHYYNGRIYIGSGDYKKNRGPIDVWSFEDDSGNFTPDIRVAEEEVCLFRDYDGKLFIPGKDPRGDHIGTIYIKNGEVWETMKTLPPISFHVTDVALFNGNLYTHITSKTGQFLESSDMGQTWTYLMTNLQDDHKMYFEAMVSFDDFLLIMGNTNFIDYRSTSTPAVFKYADGNLETLEIPLFPSTTYYSVERLIRFKDGVLYTTGGGPVHLFFLNDFESGAVIIEQFKGDIVRDILVRGENCYVLTESAQGDEYKGYIYYSSDLDNWILLAEFTVPNRPYSFEILDGYFYVGLGVGTRVGTESGSIYRIDSVIKGDVSKDNLVTAYDASLVLQYVVGLIELSGAQQYAADVTDNGVINFQDAVFILQYVVGLIAEFSPAATVGAPSQNPKASEYFQRSLGK